MNAPESPATPNPSAAPSSQTTMFTKAADTIDRLVSLSHQLGDADRRWVVATEGSASAAVGDGSVWVKVAGRELGGIDATGFTRMVIRPLLATLDHPDKNERVVRAALEACRMDRTAAAPSADAFLHATCLQESGAKWIAHVRPESVMHIVCSKQGAELFRKRIIGDDTAICGRNVAIVPLAEPGIALAVAARQELQRFREEFSTAPKLLLIGNYGPLALAQTEREALHIILAVDRWASILAGTQAFGGPRFIDAPADAASEQAGFRGSWASPRI